MLRIAVCDDQPMFLDEIKNLLNRWQDKPQGLSTMFFSDGDALLTAHRSAPFDIILLDVVMPLISGIETARELRTFDKNVKLVFLTASPEFAVESYTVKANNYLLKPVDTDSLRRCIEELVSELRRSSRCITVKCLDVTHRVLLDQIEYIEAQNKHTLFALSGGTIIESIEQMNTFESSLLSAGFLKCHRSYIVNPHQIDSYTKKEIITCSAWHIPISRTAHKDFEVAYFSAIFGKAGDR